MFSGSIYGLLSSIRDTKQGAITYSNIVYIDKGEHY